jgi:cellulose synthase (UDP-forming)
VAPAPPAPAPTPARIPSPPRAGDARLGKAHWPLPSEVSSRRLARLTAALAIVFAVWYLSWLLQPQRIGMPVLFGLLVACEAFNLFQAVGFWWTCSHQRVRDAASPDRGAAVDVMIPTYDEPVDVVEPTVAAAVRMSAGRAEVWLLDDDGRHEMAALAARHGARYVARSSSTGAKAGNINNALRLSSAPFVCVLDCDHVPRENMLERIMGHLEDPEVAFVQTPQYYANAHDSSVAAAAAAQQALFFGPIARGKDGLGAMFCCGTNVVFRRAALESVGGFPEDSITEDFELSIRLHERGWTSVYHPEIVALGLGPEDMASYVSQQHRWARGCLTALPLVLRARLPWRLRLQYMLSASYFLTGWTLMFYMALPIVRILSGAQPLAATTADQFLLHFSPYYLAALTAVAIAGAGTYTFSAFALAASGFWVHVSATLSGLLRRPARFIVTPKHGSSGRQPRAVAPALAALGALIGVAAWGLLQNRGPATLNNVAFAGLHASVLTAGILPALMVRRSEALVHEPRPPRVRAHRRWPLPVAAAAVVAALLVPATISVVGNHALALKPNLSERGHADARAFLATYVDASGRVVRRDQGGDTVSEGQAYAMLLAVALDDRQRFATVWGWTQSHLLRADGLLASRWAKGRVADYQPATDADLDAARALVAAADRFGNLAYRRQGAALGHAVLARETVAIGQLPVLVAGPWARTQPPVINPSYFSPRAYSALANVDHDQLWVSLTKTSRALAAGLIGGGRALPPDWARAIAVAPGQKLVVAPGATVAPVAQPIVSPSPPAVVAAATGARAASSGLDALRFAIRAAESCVPQDRRVAAELWPLYRAAPGYAEYALNGTPRTRQPHAVSLVAAAAAARAAEQTRQSNLLLDQADRLNRDQPTYYGAAWVALARVMLTSNALGACPGPS